MVEQKRNAGRRAAEYVKDGMTVGLGTGSTAKHAVERLGERLEEEDLDIKAIPTSKATEKLAESLDIPLVELKRAKQIDLTIDGADEVGPDYNLIKGGGGALLREKIIAQNSKEYIIIVDPSKMVEELGADFDLPVEIIPLWHEAISEWVERLDCKTILRKENGEKYRTDNGNFIIDCDFEKIDKPTILSRKLNSMPGVLENGLFTSRADKIIIGKERDFEEISVD